MATFNQRDVELLFVGGAAAQSTGDISTLNDGEIGIFTPQGVRMTEGAASTGVDFIIVQGRGSEPNIISPTLNSNKFTGTYARKVTTAKVEKQDFVGYNGTSGAIDAINDNIYRIRLHMDQSLTSNHGGIYIKEGVYSSDGSATQSEIAVGLVNSLINNFSREPEEQVAFGIVNSSALATGFDFDNTLTVTKGSKVVTVATAATYNTGTPVAAGDYIRLGSTGTTAVALTSRVYQVTNVNGLVITLDHAIVEDSGTYATGSDYNQVIPSATALAANFGIKMDGVALQWKLGKIKYKVSNWQTTLEDFGTTSLTETFGAKPGVGVYEIAAEQEFFLQGNDAEIYRMGEPNIFDARKDVTVANAPYDQLHFVFSEEAGSLAISKLRQVETLLIPNTTPAYADAANADDITDVLELLLGLPAGSLAL